MRIVPLVAGLLGLTDLALLLAWGIVAGVSAYSTGGAVRAVPDEFSRGLPTVAVAQYRV